MNIRLAQIRTTVGDFIGIKGRIIQEVCDAESDNADVLLLPELATCGYPPRDFLYEPNFAFRCNEVLAAIRDRTVGKNVVVVLGNVRQSSHLGTRSLLNEVVAVQQGEVVARHVKTLLPNYDVFDEDRYFHRGDDSPSNFPLINIKGIPTGILVCEEIWNDLDDSSHGKIYSFDPVAHYANLGAKGLLIVNASPFRTTVLSRRLDMAKKHVRDNRLEFLAYTNQVGANDEIVFDGASFIVGGSSHVVGHCSPFEEESKTIDVFSDRSEEGFVENIEDLELPESMQIQGALVLGVRDYFYKQNINGPAIIGLSGGIDSAVTAVIAKQALGANRVICVGMPSEFSSEGSVTEAAQLAEKLGVRFYVSPIGTAHETFRNSLDDLFEKVGNQYGVDYAATPTRESGVTDENIQARVRGLKLMGIANRMNGLVLSTGNKSEMAVGYCTLYGDMCGGLNVLGDVYKTSVFSLAEFMNRDEEIIPWNTIVKPPSAELAQNQIDTDSLPPYAVIDHVIRMYAENSYDISRIKDSFPFVEHIDEIERICMMIDRAEFKRRQAPLSIKITTRDLRRGRQVPVVQRWTNQRNL
jgi:NAD+ synthetase